MKKFLLFFSIFAVCGNISYAVKVQLPNEDVLQERLKQQGFDHFIEKTKIIKDLADQKKEVLGVITAVELALYDYHQYLGQPKMISLMELSKPKLIETILEGNPEAIDEARKFLKEIKEK